MIDAHMTAEILVTFGCLFLIGLLADLIGRYTPLPRVTLLLLAGFLIGPSVLNWLPQFTESWFPLLTDIALTMIGFLLGQKLTLPALRQLGRPVLAMSVGEVVMTALLIFSVLSLFGVPVVVALLLAGIAPATAPATTMDVVHELQAEGKFTNALVGIVGLILGTRLGGWLSGADPLTRRWIGLALLPQAGVAIGMVLLACQHFPELKDSILPVVLASTVIFELLGPVVTRRVLIRMGQVKSV